MKQYIELVTEVLNNGVLKKNRTGTDTLMVFGYHYKVDLKKGFPLFLYLFYFSVLACRQLKLPARLARTTNTEK